MTTMKDNISATDLTTLEKNKATIRKLMKAVNNQDLAALDGLVISDYVNQQMRIGNIEEFKAVLREQYRGFPDVHRTIEDIVAEGDKVWLRVKITATHTGVYRGVAPTGKKIVMPAVPAYRIVNGKVIEGWSVWNPLDLFKQLGVVEYKGFPDESVGNHPTIAKRLSNERAENMNRNSLLKTIAKLDLTFSEDRGADMGNFFAEDATLMFPLIQDVIGRDSIRDLFVNFVSMYTTDSWEPKRELIRVYERDAYTLGSFIEVRTKRNEGTTETVYGRLLEIWKLSSDDKWELTHFMSGRYAETEVI